MPAGVQKSVQQGHISKRKADGHSEGLKERNQEVRGVHEALLRCWCLVHTGNKSVVQSSAAGGGGREC